MLSFTVREHLTGGFLRAVSHKSSASYQFLATETSGTARCSQAWGHRMRHARISFSKHFPYDKTACLDPLSWDVDCLLTLWPLLIPCSLGNSCCTFGFLIFIIVERNSLYNSIYIYIYTHRKIIETPLVHQSLGPCVCLSFFLSPTPPTPSPANSMERRNPSCSLSCPGFQDRWRGRPVPSWAMPSLCQGLYWFPA